jgi:poly(A) polymerase Pap1
MLNHLIKRLEPRTSEKISAQSLVLTFFGYYARFQWHRDIVCDPMFPHSEYRRTSREAMVILAVHSPTARPNVASSCTKFSALTVSREMALAEARLMAGDWYWPLRSTTLCFQDFEQTFTAFVIAHINMWELQTIDQSAQRVFFGQIESRTPALMVQLGHVASLYAQAWPFQLRPGNDEVEEGEQMKVCYVIGILVTEKDMDLRKLAQSKVLDIARKFESTMQSSKEYRPSHMWIQLNVQSRKKLIELDLQQTAGMMGWLREGG